MSSLFLMNSHPEGALVNQRQYCWDLTWYLIFISKAVRKHTINIVKDTSLHYQAPPEDLINEYACLGFWLLGEFPVARGDSIFLVVFISFWVPDYLFVWLHQLQHRHQGSEYTVLMKLKVQYFAFESLLVWVKFDLTGSPSRKLTHGTLSFVLCTLDELLILTLTLDLPCFSCQ